MAIKFGSKPVHEILGDQTKGVSLTTSIRPKIEIPETAKQAQRSGRKIRITIWLDPDVVEHFRKTGRDWHPRINSALRKAAGL